MSKKPTIPNSLDPNKKSIHGLLKVFSNYQMYGACPIGTEEYY